MSNTGMNDMMPGAVQPESPPDFILGESVIEVKVDIEQVVADAEACYKEYFGSLEEPTREAVEKAARKYAKEILGNPKILNRKQAEAYDAAKKVFIKGAMIGLTIQFCVRKQVEDQFHGKAVCVQVHVGEDYALEDE